MAIHSFLKAEKGDPDWQFSPEDYFGKEFKIIDANMIEIEENQSERVVLRQNPTEKDLLAKRLNIVLQKNSILDLIILNEVDSCLQQVFLYDVHLKPGASLSLGMFVKDGKLNKHIIQVYCEDNAVLTVYGLISNDVEGDSEIITKVIQNGESSISNQLVLSLAGNKAQTVCQGTVIANESAVGSHINLENSNLVTGEGGRCFSKPETYHSAEYITSNIGNETSTISEEKIGYLQSRGISEKIARNLIITSFRNQVIDLVTQAQIKEEIKEMYVD
jgi:Fe-S cluster assembly protein SufD